MILNISQYGDVNLRAKATRVETVDETIRKLADDMLETLHSVEGIGLAAPQVFKTLRLVVIDIPEDEDEQHEDIEVNGEKVPMRSIMPLVFINPEIEPYGKQEFSREGCLSVHDLRASVGRPRRTRAKLTLLDGSTLQIDCGGLLARCLQHECDHLEGVLFTDRISSAARVTIAKRLRFLQFE